MITISVTPQDYVLADLLSSMQFMSSKMLPKTYKAVKMAAAAIMYTWKSYVMGAPIPGAPFRIKNPTGKYASSIKVRRITPFWFEVYTEYEVAKRIEEGTKQFDMKKTHPFGKKGRVSKKGVPYNIIPFRHGAPGSLTHAPIPEQMYAKIRQALRAGELTLSQVTQGKKIEPNYKGELIPRARYQWGSRMAGTGIDRLEGLVVMTTSTAKSSRSQYMTFRVISGNSPAFKWIQPGRPARPITKYVAANTQELVGAIILQGVKEDLGLA